MATVKSHKRIGVIILGNSGVGKSFLANIFLGHDTFTHKATATAVTTKTEFHEVTFEDFKYAIFNIPGLVEAEQAQIDTNKQEIDRAFKECPNAVIIYVFGNQNGRIRNEDVIAFNALNDAYPFESKSLVLVVNCIPAAGKRDQEYEGQTIVLLRKLLDLKTWDDVCFLDQISTEDEKAGKQKLRQRLVPSILLRVPNIHVKKHDIRLQADELNEMMKKHKETVKTFEAQRTQLQNEFRLAQEKYESDRKKQQEALEVLIRAQKEREEADARHTRALQRGAAVAAATTTATAPLAAASGPFAPLVAGLSAAGGFALGFFADN